MKKRVLLLFIVAVCIVFMPGHVLADYGQDKITLVGSIQGLGCVTQKKICPIGMEAPMAALEDVFVFLTDPVKTEYYMIPNVNVKTLARFINEQVKVVGYVDAKHNTIWADEIYSGNKLLWSGKQEEELRQQMKAK
jgi:hypothetical protein